jgi:hypothetical protein
MGYERAEELVNDVALASSSVELIRRIAEYICPDDDVQTECNPVVPVKVTFAETSLLSRPTT